MELCCYDLTCWDYDTLGLEGRTIFFWQWKTLMNSMGDFCARSSV
jgi:hypothetical protein